jgi:hypothetical protein
MSASEPAPRIWRERVRPRVVKVYFQHKGLGNNPWVCYIHDVTVRYRVPS